MPSLHTRRAYRHDLDQSLAHAEIEVGAWEQLAGTRPEHIAARGDRLTAAGLTNSSIRRKLTALRSLFSYLKTNGYIGPNPAHGDSVTARGVASKYQSRSTSGLRIPVQKGANTVDFDSR